MKKSRFTEEQITTILAVTRAYNGISGPYGEGRLSAGIYTGNNLRLRTAKGMVCGGQGWSFDLNPNFSTSRTNLRIHPDESPIGTKGCIGVSCTSVAGNLSDSQRLYNDLKVPGQIHLQTANQAAESGLFGGVGWYEEGYHGPRGEGEHVHVNLRGYGARWGFAEKEKVYHGYFPKYNDPGICK